MQSESTKFKTVIISTIIFSIAMGFLEAVVVVYLRQLYYPNGFNFPLQSMALPILKIEYFRELATMVMLCGISFIAGRTLYSRFAYFIFNFAVWDIFYYIWLKVMINWPESLFTWDILFLIPIVWVGPVLAPLICSVTMILLAGVIIYFEHKGYSVKMKLIELILLLGGAFIIFCTYIWDYGKLAYQANNTHQNLQNLIAEYIPTHFNWVPFILGELLIMMSILIIYRRHHPKLN
jgi:hypothetical protein